MQENNKQSKVDKLISKVNAYNERLFTAANNLDSNIDTLFGSNPVACDEPKTEQPLGGKYNQLEDAINALGIQCDTVARVIGRFVDSGLV